MKTIIFGALLLAFVSCQNTETDKQVTIVEQKDSVVLNTDTVPKLSAHADSIEHTNAATIWADGNDVQKAIISKADSSITLGTIMKMDHRIFGYERPDTSSKRMILLSIFTDDVKDNPFKLPFGTYYQTDDMKDLALKYAGDSGTFIKADVLKNKVSSGTVYIPKNLVEFDD